MKRLRARASGDAEADYATALVLAKATAACALTDSADGFAASLRDGVKPSNAARRVGEAVDIYNQLMQKQPESYAAYLAKASLLLRAGAEDGAWKAGTAEERRADGRKLLVQAQSLAPDDKARALVAKVKGLADAL